ncbi:hypothetical protein MMC21_008502 [Puttea exsequens]|nr:hypothetical protein [Puttea exsequens]
MCPSSEQGLPGAHLLREHLDPLVNFIGTIYKSKGERLLSLFENGKSPVTRDCSIPASILRTKWTPILNSFLLQVAAGTYSRSHVDDVGQEQKAEELLKWLEPPHPKERDSSFSTIPETLLRPDASHVASELSNESWSR